MYEKRDMKLKKTKILFTLAIVSIALTGCMPHAIPDIKKTIEKKIASAKQTYEINGKKYSTGFYDEYMYVNETDVKGETVKADGEEFTPIENQFDFYSADIGNKEGGRIYCSEKEYDKAEKYYKSDNYHIRYICGNYGSEDYDYYIDGGEISYKLMNKLLTTATSFSPLKIKRNLDKCDLKLKTPELQNDYYVQGISDDKLFVTQRVELYMHEGNLYYFVLSMGGRKQPESEGYYYIKLDNELNEFLLKIIG